MAQRVQRLVSVKPGRGIPTPASERGAVEDKPLLSQEAAARRLGIGVASLRALIADGTIFAITVGATGTHKRIPVAEIEKWKTRSSYAAGSQDHGDGQQA
jgi:excisionase family DNA binding protein